MISLVSWQSYYEACWQKQRYEVEVFEEFLMRVRSFLVEYSIDDNEFTGRLFTIRFVSFSDENIVGIVAGLRI